ncbi:MAG: molybdopterin-dependent oxidoreductase [Planctomycetota bacterium]
MRKIPAVRFFALALLLSALGACAAPATRDGEIRVEGDVLRPRGWTAAEIEARFPDRVRIVDHESHDGKVRLRGLPLAELVKDAGPALDDSRKNHELGFAIAVCATDGYTSVFTYDEVVPFRDAEPSVFLAFAEESGPLPEKFGPARLVLVGHEGGSRRMRAVDLVRVVDLADRR